jgi:hypothetical protein
MKRADDLIDAIRRAIRGVAATAPEALIEQPRKSSHLDHAS